jgi:hypothetical protein
MFSLHLDDVARGKPRKSTSEISHLPRSSGGPDAELVSYHGKTLSGRTADVP